MKNAQLWKRILNEGLSVAGSPINGNELSNSIITSTIIVDSRPFSGGKHSDLRMLGPLAFPFDRFWLEGPAEVPPTGRWGAFVEYKDHRVSIKIVISSDAIAPVVFASVQADIGEDFRLVTKGPDGIDTWSGGTLKSHVDAYGDRPTMVVTLSSLFIACEALEMMACKNVSLEPRDNDPKQVARAIKRHGGNPDKYRYHVLVVRPPGAKSDSPGTEIGIMPRHVCRGHFSEYGPQFNKGLLFGKYSGRFFIPPHLKGDKKNGEVVKDYEIPGQ